MRFPRFYPILDAALIAARGGSLTELAEGVCEGGARIFQLRDKRPLNGQRLEEAQALAAIARRHGALLIVNDRTDLAMLADAGVHVGQDDLPAAAARRIIGDTAVVGLSTHNPLQLKEGSREPVDYLAIGPIFATASKDNPDPVVGTGRLATWRRFTELPLVAIGGITRSNAREVLAAGADSVAVISDVLPEVCDRREIRHRVEQWTGLLE
jgi:thiamine-phosphate pyrophosphorylase